MTCNSNKREKDGINVHTYSGVRLSLMTRYSVIRSLNAIVLVGQYALICLNPKPLRSVAQCAGIKGEEKRLAHFGLC